MLLTLMEHMFTQPMFYLFSMSFFNAGSISLDTSRFKKDGCVVWTKKFVWNEGMACPCDFLDVEYINSSHANSNDETVIVMFMRD